MCGLEVDRFGPVHDLRGAVAPAVHRRDGIELHEADLALELGILGNLSGHVT